MDHASANPSAPLPPLNRLEVLRGLKVAVWEGCSSTVWASLTGNVLLTGFALWLGASPFVIGLLTAIPTFAGLIQVVSSYFSDRLPRRKPLIGFMSVVGRILWLPILLLPFFLPKATSLPLFLALYALSYLLLNIPIPAYTAMMSDLVPPDHRGRYFGRRNMVMGLVGMAAGLPAAWFLDRMLKERGQGEIGFAVLFGLGVAGGIASFYFLMKQPEPPLHPSDTERPKGLQGALAYYKTPFADRNFVRLMTFNVLFGMGQFFAAPFFNVYAIQRLHLTYTSLQLFSTVTALMSLLSMPLWGTLTDKFGNKPLLAIGALGVVPLPIYWALTTPAKPGLSLFLIQAINVQGGLFWAGVGLTQFNLLIRSAPSDKTPIYAATMAAVTGLTGGLAPLLGGAMMKALEGKRYHFGSFALDEYRITFLTAAALRLIGLLTLRRVQDGASASARTVLYELRNASPKTWANLRRLQRGGGEMERLKATEALAESKTRLAVNELEWALRDPSLPVRSEAARALGRIGERGAVEPLLSVMTDPASGILAEAAYSLAQIGDPRAAAPLLTLAYDEERTSPERIAAIRALGRLGKDSALEPLLSLLEETPDTAAPRKTALIETLTLLRPAAVSPHALHLLFTTSDVTLQAACVRAVGASLISGYAPELISLLNGGQAMPAPSDPRSTSPAPAPPLPPFPAEVPEVLLVALADALADLNAAETAPLLASRIAELSSPLARTQVAHSVGILLGEGETLYSLLSKEPFARDAELSTLVRELGKGKPDAGGEALALALSAFLDGDTGTFLREITAFAQTHPGFTPAHRVLGLPIVTEPPVESALLALVALRQVLSQGGG